MRIIKKTTALIIATVFVLVIHLTAYAHDVPDFSQKGSITVTMHKGENVVSGGTLTIYQVGDVSESDGNYSFVLTDGFKGCGESLDDIQSDRLAKNLNQYRLDHNLNGITKDIDTNGKVLFGELESGLYLVAQDKVANGYNKADPFLVSIPYLENGVYLYDIDASPKVELTVDTTSSTPQNVPSSPSGTKLPRTGQLNWPIPVLVITGLLLFSVGWVLRFSKKGRKNA